MGVYIKNTTKEELIEWVKLVWPYGDYNDNTFDNVINIETPHGRLIDADKLPIRDISIEYYAINGVTEDDIDNAPTVIEMEE